MQAGNLLIRRGQLNRTNRECQADLKPRISLYKQTKSRMRQKRFPLAIFRRPGLAHREKAAEGCRGPGRRRAFQRRPNRAKGSGLRQSFRLRGAPQRRFGVTAAGAFVANVMKMFEPVCSTMGSQRDDAKFMSAK